MRSAPRSLLVRVSVSAAAALPSLIASAQQAEAPRAPSVETSALRPGEAEGVHHARAGDDAGWTPARLPDGQPDVQGFWRAEIGGNYSLVNPRTGGSTREELLLARDGKTRAARPSRIVDPPDGQIPYQPWARAKQQEIERNLWEPKEQRHIDPQARCFPQGVSRTQWWHEFQIRQYPDYVLFLFDAATRIVYLGDHPPLPEDIKLWMSYSRGRWEGNTLVVDVTNSNSKHRLSNEGDFASDAVRITERFTFTDRDSFVYEATYDDPSVYTRPWTLRSKALRTQADDPSYEFWEYGCHEGERNADHSLIGSISF